MRAVAPFAFRYQYLAGGVNTGGGWSTWNANGSFVTNYVQDSIANGITPVFTYYMIRQSNPGGGDDATAVSNNLASVSTMQSFFGDLKLFMQRAGAFGSNRVVLHLEPDLWGIGQLRSSGDNAATVGAKVGSTGMSELAGLPDNMAGLAQAALRLRNLYAPNVNVAYHLSVWGTGNDIIYSDPSNSIVDALAARAASFYRSLNASFDIAFVDTSDRDAAFKQFQYGDGGAAWWNDGDYARHARFIGGFVSGAAKRVVLWQTPLGNTRMRAQDNSWGHYQDNKVERFLDDPLRAQMTTYANAGVVAVLFGGGASGTSCACDGVNDGVTNPAAINGNATASYNADDDGGFFKNRAAAYYTAGAMTLPAAGTTPTPTPTATPTPTVAPTPTPTIAPTPAPTATPTAAPTATPSAAPTLPVGAGKIRWQGQNWNLGGANLPWYGWASDFGTSSGVASSATNAAVDARLAQAKAAGVKVIRWWVFPGAAAQITRTSAGPRASTPPCMRTSMRRSRWPTSTTCTTTSCCSAAHRTFLPRGRRTRRSAQRWRQLSSRCSPGTAATRASSRGRSTTSLSGTSATA